jgi:hypothetical protein
MLLIAKAKYFGSHILKFSTSEFAASCWLIQLKVITDVIFQYLVNMIRLFLLTVGQISLCNNVCNYVYVS